MVTYEHLQEMWDRWKLKPEEVEALGLDPRFTWRNFNGWLTPWSSELGIAPYFTSQLLMEINKKMPSNILVVGRTGIGKSYLANDIARVIFPNLTIDHVVFTHKQYMDLIINLPIGHPIIFDEPSYAISHREWYKELNKVLVQTIESQRFKVHPLFIPIINKSLLDKTIRQHLVHYQIVVVDRGHAIVYKISPSHFKDKTYFNKIDELHYSMFDWNFCSEDSCIGCKTLFKRDEHGNYLCNLFRAQYERKKMTIQNLRYRSATEKISALTTKTLSWEKLEEYALALESEWKWLRKKTERRLDAEMLSVQLRDRFGINISPYKARILVKNLEYKYPEKFLRTNNLNNVIKIKISNDKKPTKT